MSLVPHYQSPTPQIWQLQASGSTEAAPLRTCVELTLRQGKMGLRTAQQLLPHTSKCGIVSAHWCVTTRTAWEVYLGFSHQLYHTVPVMPLFLWCQLVNTHLVWAQKSLPRTGSHHNLWGGTAEARAQDVVGWQSTGRGAGGTAALCWALQDHSSTTKQDSAAVY